MLAIVLMQLVHALARLTLPALFQVGVASIVFYRLNLTEHSALLFVLMAIAAGYVNPPGLERPRLRPS